MVMIWHHVFYTKHPWTTGCFMWLKDMAWQWILVQDVYDWFIFEVELLRGELCKTFQCLKPAIRNGIWDFMTWLWCEWELLGIGKLFLAKKDIGFRSNLWNLNWYNHPKKFEVLPWLTLTLTPAKHENILPFMLENFIQFSERSVSGETHVKSYHLRLSSHPCSIYEGHKCTKYTAGI